MPAVTRLVALVALALAAALAVKTASAQTASLRGSYDVKGTTTVTGCHQEDCGRYRFDTSTVGAFVASTDGSFVSAPLITDCPSVPQLEGTIRQGRGGKLVLFPTNGRDVRLAFAECNSVKLRGKIRGNLKPSADGRTFEGRVVFRGSATAGGIGSSFKSIARITGARTGGSPSGAFLE